MAARERLTEAKIGNFEVEDGRSQTFIWDTDAPGLGVRATTGSRSYVFQFQLARKTGRVTIGSCEAWKLAEARIEARRMRTLVDKKTDPRHDTADHLARTVARNRLAKEQSLTFEMAWDKYISDHWPSWGDHHRTDHLMIVVRPGTLLKTGKSAVGGPVAELLDMRLQDISIEFFESWVRKEVARRPRVADKSFRLVRTFLRWCRDHIEFGELAFDLDAFDRLRKFVPRMSAKTDSLQKEMLPIFFRNAAACPNKLHGTYFLLMLLTGARPGELLPLKWADVDLRWRLIRVRDKNDSRGQVTQIREVPIGKFACEMLGRLKEQMPKFPSGVDCSEFVFFGKKNENDRPMSSPNSSLAQLMSDAELPHLTLNGLRRSYSNLCEWLEWPSGVKAQVMGHKPSATAERHYTRRPVDLLRNYQETLEAWILREAGLTPLESHHLGSE